MHTFCSPVSFSLATAPALIVWSNQAAGSDELKRLFHCHVERRYLGSGHEEIESGRRIRRCRNENIDELSILRPFKLRPCPTHGKSDSVDSLAGILDHDYLARVL